MIREKLSCQVLDSPLGPLYLVAEDAGITGLFFPEEIGDELLQAASNPEQGGAKLTLFQQARMQLEEYFAGSRREFTLPLIPQGTVFQQQAWEALRLIPYGQTISYREQAARLGSAAKARAVGQANGRNPISIIIPCHRVIAADGTLGGYGGGLERKRWLLRHEGVPLV